MQLKETGTEHMLLAILKDTSCVAYKILLAVRCADSEALYRHYSHDRR